MYEIDYLISIICKGFYDSKEETNIFIIVSVLLIIKKLNNYFLLFSQIYS